MDDRWAVFVALAVVAGAFVARGPAPWVGLGLVIAALVVRRPLLLTIAAFVLAGGLAVRAQQGLAPVEPRGFSGWVTLISDPEAARYGVAMDVRLEDGKHVQARASGAAERDVRTASAGERLLLEGRLEKPPPNASWLANRHVVGVLAIETVRARAPGAPWSQTANRFRSVLERGAVGLPVRERALFLGFVLGDTRGQPPDIADDFRGAGLSHLLAVSGQNVAFALALAGPALRRLGLRVRLPATLTVIAFFAVLTRFEPSVLRASVMAALAVTASSLGRETSSARLLSLAVAALVLIDPFLVHSVGFQLSVGACAGIAALAPVIAGHLPGPAALAEALAVTLGAQAGVAPLLVTTFGGAPVASVPANLLAAPAEGPVMVWGLGAGVVAGIGGGRVAGLVHWPTHVLIAWIAWVAHEAASAPLGELRGRELVVVTLAAVTAAVARRQRLQSVARAAVVVLLVALIAPAVHLRTEPRVRTDLTAGAVLWRAGATVLDVDGRVDVSDLLQSLRRAGVTRLDLVVARTGSASVGATLASVRRRYHVDRVLTPESAGGPTSSVVGRLIVDAEPAAGRLAVRVTVLPSGSARGPPV